jgi:hypothetical protein
MGYYISTPQTSFAIRTSDLPRFFDLVDNLMSDKNIEENGNGGSWSGGAKNNSWYSWVNTEEVRRAVLDRDIRAVFEAWGYDLELTNEEDGISHFYLDIRGGDAKIGDEEKFFAAIAPVVVHGCFIDVKGEDGGEWRWLWENGKFYSQDIIRKEIHFGEPNEIFFEDANKKVSN